MEKNLALTINAPGEIALAEKEIPPLKEDEILVKVHYMAVCGSDVKLYSGHYTAPHKYPIVIGHEWLGTIIQKGADVALDVGDKVVGDCSVYCGHCYYCGVSKNHCDHIEKRGITIDGGAANYIVVKALHVNKCIDISDMRLLTLTEPMSVAVNGILNRVPEKDLKRARKVLIFGAGGIGLMSLFTIRDNTDADITIADISEGKLKRVQDFGFENVTTLCTKDVPASDAGIGEFDIIIEATGTKDCLSRAITLAAPCGHLCLLGHQSPQGVDMGTVVKKSMTIYGSNGSTGGFERAMKLIEKNAPYVDRMITKTVEFEKAPEAFRAGIASPDDIKVLIKISELS